MSDNTQHHRIDCHMHTPLCGHATGDPKEYVEAAADKGISLITFTCHIPMLEEAFAQKGIRMAHEDLPRYREMIGEAREFGQDKGVEVLFGIEAEIHPDEEAMQRMDETIEAESFDYVLGSLHHMLPSFRQYLEANDQTSDADKVSTYFRCLADGAASGRYHSLAHPDVIRIYGSLEGPFVPAEHKSVITDTLDAIAASGICMEINTSGLIKGDYVVHPDPEIMGWALERGIPFTIGSDSHTPQMVGQYFEEVIPQFKELGLSKLHYFKKGQRQTVPI